MSYSQEIYDAVRSRISNVDIGSAVEAVARDAFDMSYPRAMAQEQIAAVGYEMMRPSVLFRPEIFPDGTMWCALLGADLQVGIAGFGETPAAACAEFDKAFWNEKTPTAARLAKATETGTAETLGSVREADDGALGNADLPHPDQARTSIVSEKEQS